MFTCRHLMTSLALSLSLCVVGFSVPATAAETMSDQDASRILEATQLAVRKIHDRVAPAVVSITSSMEVRSQGDLFEFFFGTPRQPRTQTATGSGVIIRPEGIIITNSHVVQGATKVTVQLPNSEQKLPAEVVQADTRTDLAVVRITQKGTYPTVPLGDAGTVRVGDWAIAFGSPFSLPSTMTMGVISATGRQLTDPSDEFRYTNLLQTDAAINPGNSGGPLVNLRGEVIGINFMIFSPGERGGSVGIGFAIPVNATTRRIIDTLASGRAFERGRMGVAIRDLDDPMREAYSVPGDGGVLVLEVEPGKAADKAGIKPEDVLVEFDGKKIANRDQFAEMVENTQPGTKINIRLIRNGKPQQVSVTITAQPNQAAAASAELQKTGLEVTTLTAERAQRYRLPNVSGVLVTRVQPGSPAEAAELQPGDVITRIGVGDAAQEVKTDDEFWTAYGKAMTMAKRGVVVQFQRAGRWFITSIPRLGAE